MYDSDNHVGLGFVVALFIAGLLYYGSAAFSVIGMTQSKIAFEDRILCEAKTDALFFTSPADRPTKAAHVEICMEKEGRRIFK